jgi:hypothetical protein
LTKTDSLEAADLDQLQGEACAGHQVAFEAALGADEERGMPAVAEFVRYGEGRNNVTAGTSTREEEGARVHLRASKQKLVIIPKGFRHKQLHQSGAWRPRADLEVRPTD